MASYAPVNTSWYRPGGILHLPSPARSALEAYNPSASLQQIVILDQWLPCDRGQPGVPITPSTFWTSIVTGGASALEIQGDIIPCAQDDVIVQHDVTPFLPPPLRRPPVASTLTWTPTNLMSRAARWAYHGRVPGLLDQVVVALGGSSSGWLDMPAAVAYARGCAYIYLVCEDVQYVLWRPSPCFAAAWWEWVGAQLGHHLDDSDFVPYGMGRTVHDPLPLRRTFQVGSAGPIQWGEEEVGEDDEADVFRRPTLRFAVDYVV